MNKKNIIIIVVVIILIIVGVIFLSIGKKNENGDGGVKSEEIAPERREEPGSDEIVIQDTEDEGDDLSAVIKSQLAIQARAFIERYGTYSSDSGFQNLRELLGAMTQDFADVISVKIDKGIEEEQVFFSVVLKVGSIKLKEFIADSRAVFSAQVQQQDMRKGSTDISTKTAELTFVKVGGEWKVDSIEIR